ncbi:MAG: hypothetical protein GF400_05305 [Candidatus Eisenbacteria bacterium]|nr:hypothetical protein [Candidatus Eisenbacteria bacterium]
MRTSLTLTVFLTLLATSIAGAQERIVFTANQEFLSRIYVLSMNGSVENYHEYEFYRWCDMEVVDGELYVADAFAPRVYRVDVDTGDLELVIDDWSLYYFYGLAFDGQYFYLDEWDLNRYTIDGDKDGTSSFDESVFGAAWDGQYLWTLDDSRVAKCWDVAGWPSLARVPESDIMVPSYACRGLFFDGECFWSAESREDTLGLIYRFDHDGTVVRQWTAPAFRGWGACLLPDPTGIDALDPVGEAVLSLSRPRHNPAAGPVRLALELTEPGEVTVTVHDVAGRLVATLLDGERVSGVRDIVWPAEGAASGVYFVRARSGEHAAAVKALVLR